MKKILAIILTFSLVIALAGGVPAEAKKKSKKIRLNKTSISVMKGKSIQLKLKNAKKKVKWSSKNKFTASVNKKGKVTGKRLGTTTIIAKCAKKKYSCKVKVISTIDADKIKMNYANNVFTEDLYKKVVCIKGGVCGTENLVVDSAAIKLIFSKLAAMKLTETKEEVKPEDMRYGFVVCNLVLSTGEIIEVSFSNFVNVGDKKYVAEPDYRNEINQIINGNKDWGDV